MTVLIWRERNILLKNKKLDEHAKIYRDNYDAIGRTGVFSLFMVFFFLNGKPVSIDRRARNRCVDTGYYNNICFVLIGKR